MSGEGPILIGVLVTGAALGGLVLWGRARVAAKREQMAKDDPTIAPVAFFPGLKVGDVVVDTALARLPAPFASVQKLPAEVDMVLQDPAVISVKVPPGIRIPGAPFFSGTIPRESILGVLKPPPFQPTALLEL